MNYPIIHGVSARPGRQEVSISCKQCRRKYRWLRCYETGEQGVYAALCQQCRKKEDY